MNNVIKFQKPKQVKPPRQTPPWLRKALTSGVIILGFAAAWAYFQFGATGTPVP